MSRMPVENKNSEATPTSVAAQNGHNIHNKLDDKIEKAINLLNQVFSTYNENEIFLSFNGGKDCTVLLHLSVQVYRERYPNGKLLCVHVRQEHPFEEMLEFVEQCHREYNVEMKTIIGDLRNVVENLLKDNPTFKACLMGCRRTDPHCESLTNLQMTDANWPPLMRINPLLDWTYDEIWSYLFTFNVKYCSLYEIGYTSLGNKSDTVPNRHLLYFNSNTGKEEHKHASELEDEKLERAGRYKRI